MTEHRAAHIAWLKHRLATEAMDEWTRCQVLAALSLAQGYWPKVNNCDSGPNPGPNPA